MASNAPAPTANPVPFGLACYGICVVLLSAFLLGLVQPQGLIGYALFTGGLGMFVAGWWAFRAGSTFGGTVLTGYGAFWASTAFYLWFLIGGSKDAAADLTWIAIVWGVFTLYVTLNSMKVGLPLVTGLLAVLFVVYVLVIIANGAHVEGAAKLAGVLGIISGVLAWIQSYQGVQQSLG